MWSREELKARGKMAYRRNYWAAVVVSLVVAAATGKISWQINGSSGRGSGDVSWIHGATGSDHGAFLYLFGLIMAAIFGSMVLIITVLKALIGNILTVGACRYYMENREYKSRVEALFYGFRKGRYVGVALTMFITNVFIFLWSLLFIVPGIIKSYEYRMVPYILSENPTIGYKRAIEISRQMMDGQKMDTFILDLSFIGWYILSAFTCNILGVFYTMPYYDATNAELYAVLREHVFRTGQFGSMDLPGFGGSSYYQM